MIITRTPFRISFFGGGTDYPEYYMRYGGKTLSVSLDKYCYISLRKLPPFLGTKYRVVYSNVELTDAIDDIIHPAVREGIRFSGITDGLEVTHFGDLPHRAGLGSSSSFAVGIVNALNAYAGKQAAPQQMAADAIHIERVLIGDHVGDQDQMAAAYGGFNAITYDANGRHVNPCVIKADTREQLKNNLVLVFTGLSRFATEIAKEQVRTIGDRLAELESIKKLVDTALSILMSGSTDDFGTLLHETWMIKRTLTDKISNPEIDELYEAAMASGALGGKLLGAGGGGFMLFYVPDAAKAAFNARFEKHVRVPIGFDYDGSRVIYLTDDIL